jgi:hypothetical protein
VAASQQNSKANDEGLEGGYYFGFPIRQLRQKKEEACLGYLSMNVIAPPDGAFWGKFNNRALDQNWIKSLADTFETNLDNCTTKTAMDIAIDPDWLVPKIKIERTVEGMLLKDVSMIEFNPEGLRAIKDKNLWVLGGNHRRIALAAFRDRMKDTVAEMNAAIDAVKKRLDELSEEEAQDLDNDPTEVIEELSANVERLEDKILVTSMWAMRLYDRGTSPVCVCPRSSKSAPDDPIAPSLQPK